MLDLQIDKNLDVGAFLCNFRTLRKNHYCTSKNFESSEENVKKLRMKIYVESHQTATNR